MSRNRLLLGVITEMIKEEIANEVDITELGEDLIEREKDNWLTSIGVNKENRSQEIIENKLKLLFISQNEMEQQCEIEAKVFHWSANKWNDDIPALYLDKKESFDIATYRIIRFEKDRYNFANEVYHRIKNEELTFKEACMLHGSEKDKLSRGRPITQSFDKINPSIRKRLNSMRNGQICKPYEIPDWVIINELLAVKSSLFDKEVKQILIKRRLASFLKFGAIKIATSIQNTSPTAS